MGLLRRIRVLDMHYAEAEMPQVLDMLVRGTACPHVSDLIYWPKRPMTAQEIVDTALAHRAIILGSGT